MAEGPATPPAPTAAVPAAVPVPLQAPFVKNVNVTVPVMARVLTWPLTVAVSYTELPKGRVAPFAITPLPAALCRVVAVVVGFLPTVNGSHGLFAGKLSPPPERSPL